MYYEQEKKEYQIYHFLPLNRFNEVVKTSLKEEDFIPEIYIDAEIDSKDITNEVMQWLEYYEQEKKEYQIYHFLPLMTYILSYYSLLLQK